MTNLELTNKIIDKINFLYMERPEQQERQELFMALEYKNKSYLYGVYDFLDDEELKKELYRRIELCWWEMW